MHQKKKKKNKKKKFGKYAAFVLCSLNFTCFLEFLFTGTSYYIHFSNRTRKNRTRRKIEQDYNVTKDLKETKNFILFPSTLSYLSPDKPNSKGKTKKKRLLSSTFSHQ